MELAVAGADLPTTAPEPLDLATLRRSRLLRRVGLGAMAVFVVCGAVGLFGIKTGRVTGSGAGYDLSLEYPATDRPGQPIHWVLTVHRAGGFGGPVDVGITQGYLDLLDLNDIQPQPSDARSSGPFVIWTFAKPDGDTLAVSIDAQIQLNGRWGSEATVAVMEHGTPVAQVHWRTWVAP